MFEFLEHTADVGILVRGETLEEFFAEAARGMFAILCESTPEGEAIVHEINLNANDIESLLVNFLSELLFLFESKSFVPREFQFHHIDEGSLDVVCIGAIAPKPFYGTEIKGITHHMLEVESTPNGLEARIYFDL